jgi:hypothetical protein
MKTPLHEKYVHGGAERYRLRSPAPICFPTEGELQRWLFHAPVAMVADCMHPIPGRKPMNLQGREHGLNEERCYAVILI